MAIVWRSQSAKQRMTLPLTGTNTPRTAGDSCREPQCVQQKRRDRQEPSYHSVQTRWEGVLT